MKRIQEACLAQTVHFQLKEDLSHQLAVKAVKEEVEQYKAKLDKSRVRYRIEEEKEMLDGSVVIKIKKQYQSYPCGNYLDTYEDQ